MKKYYSTHTSRIPERFWPNGDDNAAMESEMKTLHRDLKFTSAMHSNSSYVPFGAHNKHIMRGAYDKTFAAVGNRPCVFVVIFTYEFMTLNICSQLYGKLLRLQIPCFFYCVTRISCC